MAGLFHNLHHFVERYLVCPVSQHGIRIGIHGTGGSIGIAFDAGDLHQTANRVAGQSQMVFQSHFGCIFDLCRCASEQLGCGSGRHGTSYAHFSLASYFSTGYGCIFLHDVSEKAGCGQSSEDTLVADMPRYGEMV